MTIKRFDSENVGKYFCKANNSIGQNSKEVTVGIKLKPILTINPLQLSLKEGDQASVKCVVENAEASSTLKWKVGSNYVTTKVKLLDETQLNPV